MKRLMICGAFLASAMVLSAADAGPKDEVAAAAKKLAEKPNYSWKTTVAVPEGTQWRPGPTEGKAEKDGFTCVEMSMRDSKTQVVMKGEKVAFTNQEGEWQTVAEAENAEGPGRFMARMMRNFKAPAAQAAELASGAKELKKDGDAFAGEMSDEGAKAQFRFGNVTDPKGTVKFWVKDGALAKYEFKVTGKVDFNGNQMDIDRTTTTEIKEVGTTKVEVPEAAKKKL